MTLIIESNHEQLSKRASALVLNQIHSKPDSLLVLPAGDTPMGMYRQIVQNQAEQNADIHELCIIVLDEWGGFPPDHPFSCQYEIKKAFAEPIGLPDTNFHALDGSAKDPKGECQRYNQLLAKFGPVDLAILGLGINGHIGLNEPALQLSAQAHIAKLAPSTIERVNRQMGNDQAPTFGLTLGMAQILQARQVLLLASGNRKAKAVGKMLAGPITTKFPASLLQLHPAVVFLIDEDAAEQLDDR